METDSENSTDSRLVAENLIEIQHTSGVTDVNHDMDCLEALVKQGFENVTVQKINGVMRVAMEDTRYRGTFRGAAKALMLLAEIDPGCTDYEILLKEWNVGRIVIHATRSGSGWDADVNYSLSDEMKQMVQQQPGSRSTYGKVDIVFHPMFSLDNHRLDVVYQVMVRLAPSIETSLWKGNRLVLQPIIPIYNNYRDFTSDKYFQLGTAAVFQNFACSPKWWLRAGLGQFRYDRLGVNVNTGFRINTYLDASVIANLTTESCNFGHRWYVGFGEDFQFSAMAKLSYYEPCSSMQVELMGGRFLYGDYGGRVDISRHIGEYTIGIYGIATSRETNFGFHFAIPVGGKSQFRKGWVRPRLPQYYTMEYSQKVNFRYAWEKLGQRVIDMPDESRSSRYWQARYIQRYLQKSLNEGFE